MKKSLLLAAGLFLVLTLVFGVSTANVAAQGPVGTQTPVQAPPASAATGNLDESARAQTLGNTVGAITPNTAEWFRFEYDNGGNTAPHPTVVIRLLNGVQNGLNFEVWSPERLQGNWWENKPVGRGTQEGVPNCSTTDSSGTPVKCTSNDLTWVGGFGLSGTYYIRIINNNTNNAAVAPQIVVSGAGLANCVNSPQFMNQMQGQGQGQTNNQGFIQVVCGTAPQTTNQVPSQVQSGTTTPVAPSAGAISDAPPSAATEAPSPAATETTTGGSSAPSGILTPAPAPRLNDLGLEVTQNATLGQILTDSQGRTLYVFAQDTANKSNCDGSCAQTWPPLSPQSAPASGAAPQVDATPQSNTTQPSAGQFDTSLLSSITRSDGSTQVTHNGHPLYYFSGDKNPGDANGEGVGGVWFAVSPSGTPVQAGASATSTVPAAGPSPSAGSTPQSAPSAPASATPY